MDEQQLIADLQETAHQLSIRGRSRGGWESSDGRVCVAGAARYACGLEVGFLGFLSGPPPVVLERRSKLSRFGEVCRALQENLPEGFALIAHFNDDLQTTDQDCFDLIEKTLANLGGLH